MLHVSGAPFSTSTSWRWLGQSWGPSSTPVCPLDSVSSQNMETSGSQKSHPPQTLRVRAPRPVSLWASLPCPLFLSLLGRPHSLPAIFGAEPVEFRVVHPGLQSQGSLIISHGNWCFFKLIKKGLGAHSLPVH